MGKLSFHQPHLTLHEAPTHIASLAAMAVLLKPGSNQLGSNQWPYDHRRIGLALAASCQAIHIVFFYPAKLYAAFQMYIFYLPDFWNFLSPASLAAVISPQVKYRMEGVKSQSMSHYDGTAREITHVKHVSELLNKVRPNPGDVRGCICIGRFLGGARGKIAPSSAHMKILLELVKL